MQPIQLLNYIDQADPKVTKGAKERFRDLTTIGKHTKKREMPLSILR